MDYEHRNPREMMGWQTCYQLVSQPSSFFVRFVKIDPVKLPTELGIFADTGSRGGQNWGWPLSVTSSIST